MMQNETDMSRKSKRIIVIRNTTQITQFHTRKYQSK